MSFMLNHLIGQVVCVDKRPTGARRARRRSDCAAESNDPARSKKRRCCFSQRSFYRAV